MLFETLIAIAIIGAIVYFGYKYFKKAKATGRLSGRNRPGL